MPLFPKLTAPALILAATATGARADVPQVMTDIPPVQSLVAEVMGDLGTPDLLVQPGAEAHDLQLKPSQVATLSGADLMIWIGPEMTPWLPRVLEANFAGQSLTLLAAPGAHQQPFADGSGTDPHAFLDPDNAQAWLTVIAAALSAADPDHAASYKANAESARADLARVDAGIAQRLSAVTARPLVVGHDAFGYFAAHYGLTIAGAIAAGDEADPGAAHLSDLTTTIRSAKVRCIFPEAGHNPGEAETLAEATGARVGPALDPEAQLLTPGPALYTALLTGLADGILSCAGG